MGEGDKVSRFYFVFGEFKVKRFFGGNGISFFCFGNKNFGIFFSVVCEFNVKVIYRFV